MTDIQKLKNLDFLEKLGWLVKRNPRKTILTSAVVLLSVVIILSVPGMISENRNQRAENYINESEQRLDRINSTVETISANLKENKRFYKEFDLYNQQIVEEKDHYKNLVSELDEIKRDYKNKEIKKVLNQFQTDREERKTVFPEKLSEIEKELGNLNQNITAVMDIDAYLISQYSSFLTYQDSLDPLMKSRYDNLQIILSKGKTITVKNKANQYFSAINDARGNFLDGLKSLKPYTEADRGQYPLAEMKAIRQKYQSQNGLMTNSDASVDTFDQYWNQLHEQYYTLVKDQYSTRTTDYITEPNPQYREWTETETYQDTETYTEREYVGSRIVGDQQEDIYETVTKTRPVTRTRMVTRNNGQPQTISVPYDVYSFYFTVERHTLSGVSETNVYAGKKHEKFDRSIREWNYEESQSPGYVEWKQLWNDNEGILRGKNISPKLE